MKLAIFDMDGTLLDSQALIVGAMQAAFAIGHRPAPPRAAILGIVGLSLPVAIARLAPDLGEREVEALTAAYRAAFIRLRAEMGGEAAVPLYPGATEALTALDAAGWLLGVATGKAKRGVDHVFAAHPIGHHFVTVQTADFHPSKPHPAMVETALAEAGVDARDAVMIGDTTFDIEMGRAAGVRCIGVSWGYHPVEALHDAGAHHVIAHFDQLAPLLAEVHA